MSGSGYNPPPRVVDINSHPLYDINGDGRVEDWEEVSDWPPAVFGIISSVLFTVHTVLYFLNGHGTSIGSFTFTTWFNAGMTLSIIFSWLCDLP